MQPSAPDPGGSASPQPTTGSTPDEVQARARAAEGSPTQVQSEARQQLRQLWETSPLSTDDLLVNLGLYQRSSVMVRQLLLHELYKRIVHLPGALVEFGVWWGQNLVLLENLRAIHEPFNKERRIVGFDTFCGYRGFSDRDRRSDVFDENSYATPGDYAAQLQTLLDTHEQNNVLGHVSGNHQLVVGDIVETAPRFFAEHPHTPVAFAYFDLGLFEPTRAALKAITPHLMPGSILLLDEFTWEGAPGEALAFRELFGFGGKQGEWPGPTELCFRLEKCALMPHKTIAVAEKP